MLDDEADYDVASIGGWGVRSKCNGDPQPGNRFRFRVRAVRVGEAKLKDVILPLLGPNQDK